MQRMRVSAMRITRTDGQLSEKPIPVVSEEKKRQSLRLRLKKIEKKYQLQKAEMEALKRDETASRRFAYASESHARARRPRAERPARATHSTRTMRREHSARENPAGIWRRDALLQAGVCVIILASVMAFHAIDTPFTNRVNDGITKAVTMEIDFNRNLGELQFVKNIMPESALVFWEKTADAPQSFILPLNGEMAVRYTDKLPGVLLIGAEDTVYAAADGEVVSVTKGDDGDYILKIRHNGGVETLYAFLKGVKVAPGDRVQAGQDVALGMPISGGAQLYFQSTRDGEPFNPEELFTR